MKAKGTLPSQITEDSLFAYRDDRRSRGLGRNMALLSFIMAIAFPTSGCSDMSALYERPLWEWRNVDTPSTEIQIGARSYLTMPASPSIFRTSFRDDPERPNVYFFIDPETGVLADWSHIERYRDVSQVTMNFWQPISMAKRSIGWLEDREDATSRSASHKQSDRISAQDSVGNRETAFVCDRLLTDVSGNMPLECRAVTPMPWGGTAEFAFSNPRGDDPLIRLRKLTNNLSKIENTFHFRGESAS